MFQEQIDHAIATYARITIGESASIMFKEIARSPMPEALQRFFSLETDKWTAAERERLQGSQQFSYTDPELLAQIDRMVQLAKGNALFPRDTFLSILDNTVNLLFNFVCRPQYTLLSYLFSEAENVPSDLLVERIGHFLPYDYYRVILSEYIALKSLTGINRERFEELLELIDHEVVRNLDSRGLAHLTQPIFEMFNPGDDSEFVRVPIEALTIFFDDKNLPTIVEHLEREQKLSPSVTLHDLVMLIGDVDFSTGSDIRRLVSRHYGEEPAPRPAPSGDLSPLDVIISDSDVTVDHRQYAAASNNVGINDGRIEHTGLDTGLVAGSLNVTESTRDEAPIPYLGTLEEEIPRGGEQETPLFDTLEMDSEIPQAETHDEVVVPAVYLEDAAEPVEPMEDLPATPESVMPEIGERLKFPDDVVVTEDQPAVQEQAFDSTLFQPVAEAPSELDLDAMLDDIPQPASMEDDEAQHMHIDTAPSLSVVEKAPAPVDSATESAEDIFDDVPSPQLPDLGSGRTEPTSLADLRTLFPPQEKKKFVKKLFNRSDAAFDKALDELNARGSWPEASEYLDELFIEQNVDLYSRIAVEFTDLVFARFNPKK
jgi:hypothetical protein